MRTTLIAALIMALGAAAGAAAQTDTVQYLPRYFDPILEEMEDAADSLKAARDSVSGEIRKRQKDRRETERKERRELRFDMTAIPAPDSPGVFTSVFHFPPVRQYATGTCWSFSATSFIESEVARKTGRQIKLSEMHTVYYEFIAKARRYLRERGDSWNGEGSEANALLRIIRAHGMVPLAVYSGRPQGGDRHDHGPLAEELTGYLEHVKARGDWDEEAAIAHVRLILNRHLGEPPARFRYEGKTYTPLEFMSEVLTINPDDYVDLMSTLSLPFFRQGPFEVPDNWWHDSTYYNVPLDQWYNALAAAIRAGYSVELGGDVSEPGWYGKENLAVVPDFDIPPAYITPAAREFRFYNQTTTDDHGVHLVGYTTIGDRDWYLIKDSGSSARRGKFGGYFFMRDDYLRLKMLSFTVHKDAVAELLKSFSTTP
ncbi:MAG TPA: C1 family peptidase [bacterium]|nr:C1 family peptidase [bacterium]